MKTFFGEIWKAISDFKFYKVVKNFSAGKAFKYILSLILLVSLILSIRYSFVLGAGLNVAMDWMKENLPVIEVQNGVASVNAEQPFKIAEQDFAVILDTTGKTASLDGYAKGVLLMKDKVIYKESEVKTEIYSLADVKSLRIDENFMNGIKKNAIWIIFPFMLLGIYIYMILARLLQTVIFSLITVFAAAINKVQLAYSQIFAIGIYAVTLSTLLGAMAALFLKEIPGMGWIYAAIYITYLIVAVINCKET
ncbi:MAG: DUF1189 domain-containing protein [Candidatus Omnitrophica bacterium]|nr:DUF1189 domain-containing protein [Candidatus Omnitrophota bacterium]MBU4487736.1 DUF1189 domain-containing protein [Candidatus Omnitrophota bacterium]MCG2705276.1 DUF1189 domain-containing protein [Candidatus Omnitrophota bacterium]